LHAIVAVMRGRVSAVVFVLGIVALAAAVFVVLRPDVIRRIVRAESPHDRYARALEESGLANSALAVDWIAAATAARQAPGAIETPFVRDITVDAAKPLAAGFALSLKRGQKLDIRVTMTGPAPARVFLDLFPAAAPANRAVLSAPENSMDLAQEVTVTGSYILRVQPELLREGRMRVAVNTGPSLAFPVAGATARSVQSAFGDRRDAGRRRHEGVDIFAARGTPVLAASSGVVTSVGENRLGGRVVWVLDVSRGLTQYYAHLQDQAVRPGQFVSAGDTLGTVGNTGNARTTPPHLHFGIYAPGHGALDPAPFIRPSVPVD
jgi:murein DD-endopeptidase MepM/ murein hydrolase activator NlpD